VNSARRYCGGSLLSSPAIWRAIASRWTLASTALVVA
jgi:hypothetical protein